MLFLNGDLGVLVFAITLHAFSLIVNPCGSDYQNVDKYNGKCYRVINGQVAGT